MERLRPCIQWSTKNLLLVGTIAGVLFGLALGFSLKPFNPSAEVQLLLNYPGELFVRALQLMIIPSVICSLFVGAGGLDAKSNGKILLYTFSYFVATSLLSTVVGVILTVTIQPGDLSILAVASRNSSGSGSRDMLSSSASIQSNSTLLDNFLDLGRNILPNNMFTAFFEQTSTQFQERNGASARVISTRRGTNTLGIIFYTLIFGIGLSRLGEKGKPVMDLFKSLESLVMNTVAGVIWVTPIGVASIICAKVLEVENMLSVMAQLGLFVVTASSGILIYQLGILQLIYFLILRKNPFEFYIGVLPAALTAFSACSSGAALPVTLKCLDRLKVDPRVSRFVVPTGVVVNMDGTALFVCTASIFIAQMNGLSLNFSDYLTICITSTAVSVATPAASPSASLTIMFIILNAINCPTEDIALLFAVDWFVDRLRTTNNVLGDCYCSAIIEHWLKSDLTAVDPSGFESQAEKAIPLASLEIKCDGAEENEKPQPQ